MKKTLWMLITNLDRADIPFVVPTIAWIAERRSVEFECYMECRRKGTLFAETGSTVIGGHHFQQFNYLNCVYDVKYILLGDTSVFNSSIRAFGCDILVQTDDADTVYRTLLDKTEYDTASKRTFGSLKCGTKNFAPYVYPMIFFTETLGYSDSAKKDDLVQDGDTYASFTQRICNVYKSHAKGAAFGDPYAILSMLPTLCREKRVTLYGEVQTVPEQEIRFSQYTEMKSSVCDALSALTEELGNKVLVGRQTGDGDLFTWAKSGMCLQIMDPNRPAFPVARQISHPWSMSADNKTIYDDEPDDDVLIQYAKEGKILATIMVHSGEMAHNEAMINFMDLIHYTGIHFGFGVHAARYQTCPQFWELLNVKAEAGGCRGYAEPVLHSGGLGVMAECCCPPDDLERQVTAAQEIIAQYTTECAPVGYYAFCDTDLPTLQTILPESYDRLEARGLEYVISSARPGRNRILYRKNDLVVLNQTCRAQCGTSPFIRVCTYEDLTEHAITTSPGWLIGTVDAPVVSFTSYIWQKGSQFMRMVDYITQNPHIVSATPNTISRYAKILEALKQKNG